MEEKKTPRDALFCKDRMHYYQRKNYFDKTDKRIDFTKNTTECLEKHGIPTLYMKC